jgi:hypothetical protein
MPVKAPGGVDNPRGQEKLSRRGGGLAPALRRFER